MVLYLCAPSLFSTSSNRILKRKNTDCFLMSWCSGMKRRSDLANLEFFRCLWARSCAAILITGLAPMYSTTLAQDPKHILYQIMWMLSYSITKRETQLCAFISLYWIWNTVLILETFHTLFAIIFVTLLGLDESEEWPWLFGSPSQAYTLRRFWGRFWHRLTATASAASGRFIAKRVFGLKAKSAWCRWLGLRGSLGSSSGVSQGGSIRVCILHSSYRS
ncbi:hypothetical protein BDV96DRAFT_379060 [Lophiotrema nucula]|uniref:Wax synthase domain-containing protein n=1 Tax=Lophiotrema nucula TaxID=690887 RepID=A0A6A5ZGY0_9PLEO|nr:hypothetical protein BDV96DRAFT_379060 [Lophiotrema nucula]